MRYFPANLMSKDNSQFVWQVHGYLNGYIKFGDTKAALLAGLAGPLIVGLVGVSGWKLKWDFETLCLLTSILLFAFAFGFAFMAIWPNLITNKVKQSKATSTSIESNGKEIPDAGFVYWKNIRAHVNANTFADELVALTEEEKLRHVGNHCYELAGITDRKYGLITISSRFFAGGMVSLAIFAVVHCGNISRSDEKNSGVDSRQSLSQADGSISAVMSRLDAVEFYI